MGRRRATGSSYLYGFKVSTIQGDAGFLPSFAINAEMYVHQLKISYFFDRYLRFVASIYCIDMHMDELIVCLLCLVWFSSLAMFSLQPHHMQKCHCHVAKPYKHSKVFSASNPPEWHFCCIARELKWLLKRDDLQPDMANISWLREMKVS